MPYIVEITNTPNQYPIEIGHGFLSSDVVISPTIIETPQTFTPPILTNLLMWIEPSDGDTVFTDVARTTLATSGSKVQGITDKSGNGYHWAQSNSANAGTYSTSGSLKTLYYPNDAGAGTYYMTYTQLTTVRTAFWVIAAQPNNIDYSFIMGDSSYYDFHGGPGTNLFFSAVVSLAVVNIDKTAYTAATAIKPTSLKVISVQTNSNANISDYSRDRNNNFGSRSWKGHLSLFLAYSSVLNGTEISDTEDSIKAYFGV